MSAMVKPLIATYEADGAISKGTAVKFGTSRVRVTPCGATTDFSIGIAQNAAVNAGDLVEVAHPGGGAKGLAQTTIAKGKLLVSHTDGSLKPTTGSGDRVIAMALDDAVASDIFGVMVIAGVATGANN